jgi:hypothetical protein
VLALSYLTIDHGSISSTTSGADGGCVYSKGVVSMVHSTLSDCTAYSTMSAGGGGLAGLQGVQLDYSTISNCTSHGSALSSTAVGGGVATGLTLLMQHSLVTGNQVTVTGLTSSNAGQALGGGIFAGAMGAYYSTITATPSLRSTNRVARLGAGMAFSWTERAPQPSTTRPSTQTQRITPVACRPVEQWR